METKMKFTGTHDEFKVLFEGFPSPGEWSEKSGTLVFRSKAGHIVNFYTNGTVQIQGSDKATTQSFMDTALNGIPAAKHTPEKKVGTKIFVVHGHDGDARDQLELILRRLGLDPFILQNNSSGSNTIIEALEHHIYGSSDFGIVLLTPDDYGYSNKLTDADRKPRARQNVILEAGMVMASLGRKNMVILKKGNLEIPSDMDGILRLEFNTRVQEVVAKLAQGMSDAGIPVDLSKVGEASS